MHLLSLFLLFNWNFVSFDQTLPNSYSPFLVATTRLSASMVLLFQIPGIREIMQDLSLCALLFTIFLSI